MTLNKHKFIVRVENKGSERDMKKALVLLVVALTAGAVQGLSDQTKKVDDMVKHTSIVSVNDNNCSGMETIKNLYYQNKAIQDSYDGNDIYVYVYHCLDDQGLSHNELEINTNRDQFRYDI